MVDHVVKQALTPSTTGVKALASKWENEGVSSSSSSTLSRVVGSITQRTRPPPPRRSPKISALPINKMIDSRKSFQPKRIIPVNLPLSDSIKTWLSAQSIRKKRVVLRAGKTNVGSIQLQVPPPLPSSPLPKS